MALNNQQAKRPIGYYVHHQGRGHATRAQMLIQQLQSPVTVFTSQADYFDTSLKASLQILPLDIADDTDIAAPNSTTPSEVLHYAPLGVLGLQQRMAQMATWIAREQPALMIIDLSAEVAMLCRLLSVPYVYVKLQGDRSDLAHRTAFLQSRGIVCAYPRQIEQYPLASDLLPKCIYTGAYSRFFDREILTTQAAQQVLILLGSGGSSISLNRCIALAKACTTHNFQVLGELPKGSKTGQDLPSNLELLGLQSDPWPYVCAARVVIASAGTNAVMEVGSARRPLICFAERRAFKEQEAKAAGLQAAGLAIHIETWPQPEEWCDVLAKAELLDVSGWDELFFDPQLAQLGARIEQLAAE